VAAVLNAVDEEDFLGFSYGFRPKRGQHDALDALVVGITTKKVNFIFDADIRSYFDSVNHAWLIRFLQHRINYPHMIRLTLSRFCARPCFAGPHSLWPLLPFAPSVPQPIARPCSVTSSLLWQGLTPRARASSATAPRLSDADQTALPRLAKRGISRFPPKEFPHMPGSSTTLGCPDARADASVHIAFRLRDGVGAQDMNLCDAQWLA
jgi:hypothetical protein